MKFFDLRNRANNLANPDRYESIREHALTKGMVMFASDPAKPVPIQEALKDDPRINDVLKKIANGEVTMTAPSAAAENEWTDADRQRLDEVLSRYYPAR